MRPGLSNPAQFFCTMQAPPADAQIGAKLGGIVAAVGADLHHVEGAASTAEIPLRKHEGIAVGEHRGISPLDPPN